MTASFLKLNRSNASRFMEVKYKILLLKSTIEKQKKKETKHDQYSLIHSFEAVLLINVPKDLQVISLNLKSITFLLDVYVTTYVSHTSV